MSYIKGQGIVLYSIDYKNIDKLVTLYLFGKGKITAIAKGVNKVGSKLKNATLSMAFGEFVLSDRNNIITSFDLIDGFFELQGSYKKFLAKTVLIDFLNRFTKDNMPDDKLAVEILKGIKNITYSDDTEEKFLVYTLLKSLSIVGYNFDFTKSSVTNNELISGAKFYPAPGGLIESNESDDNNVLSQRALKQMNYILKMKGEEKLDEIQSEKVESVRILSWLSKYISFELETKFNTLLIYLENYK